MKNLLSLIAGAAAAFGIASAQGYFGVYIGGSEVSDDGLTIEGDDNFEIDYDDGVAFGLLAGYSFSSLFAGELEIQGATNDTDFFVSENGEDFTVTTFLVNGVVSTPSNERFILWAGAGLGFASTNIDDGGNSFATQLKAGIDVSIVGPHYISVQASTIMTDSFEQDQDGIDFTVDYSNTTYAVGYRFRF